MVGELRDAIRAEDPRAAVCIVSDHGFASVTSALYLDAAFVKAGLIQLPGQGYDGGSRRHRRLGARPWPAGGSAAIVLKDPADVAVRAKVKDLLDDARRRSGQRHRHHPRPAAITALGGAATAQFWVDMRPGFMVSATLQPSIVSTVSPRGTHGYVPTHAEMGATFILAGAGIPPGRNLGAIDMRRIAPTLAKLMGVPFPSADLPALELPLPTSDTRVIHEPARTVPVRAEYDVLVVGGGPAASSPRWPRPRTGSKVGLIESRSFVGGNMTIGLPVLGFLGQKRNQIIKGLPQKFIDRLRLVNGASEHRWCPLHMGITLVEPEAVKTVALEMLTEAGVDVTFHAVCAGVVMDGDTIRGVITESKSGREARARQDRDRLHRRCGRRLPRRRAVREGQRGGRHAAADADVLPGGRRHREAPDEHRATSRAPT